MISNWAVGASGVGVTEQDAHAVARLDERVAQRVGPGALGFGGCSVRSISSSDMGWFRSSAQASGTSRALSEIAIAGTNTPS
jgi:hypothetical protein